MRALGIQGNSSESQHSDAVFGRALVGRSRREAGPAAVEGDLQRVPLGVSQARHAVKYCPATVVATPEASPAGSQSDFSGALISSGTFAKPHLPRTYAHSAEDIAPPDGAGGKQMHFRGAISVPTRPPVGGDAAELQTQCELGAGRSPCREGPWAWLHPAAGLTYPGLFPPRGRDWPLASCPWPPCKDG